nr:hypothetical protein [uncultured Capnocytophaga sp.]
MNKRFMILQENAYLEVYYGIFRDILYFDDIQTVKICFGVAFDLHFDFTFSKKYKNKEEAFAEIECYLRQDKVFNRPLDMENFDENTSAKRFIQAIIDHQVPLPKGYHYEGDIDYLKEILEKI